MSINPALSLVSDYRRRLPHIHSLGEPLFVTWRLHGSLPVNRCFPVASLTSGQAFAALDRLLDSTPSGPLYLAQPAVAEMLVEAIHYNAGILQHYDLHAFVVMANHVHLLITPRIAVSKLLRSLKGITSKRANQILGRTGTPFWQEESYDHLVRRNGEFERIRSYIEQNPVKAGVVMEAGDFRWSSAAKPARGLAADRGSALQIKR